MPTFNENLVLKNNKSEPTIRLVPQDGNIRMGGNGTAGDLALYHKEAEPFWAHWDARIWLDANQANAALGGSGKDGDILLFPENASLSNTNADEASIWLDSGHGNIMAGGNGTNGDIALFKADQKINDPFSQAEILLNSAAGDIVLRKGDCAEEFETTEPDVEPGTVVVLDDNGGVKTSIRAYDTRVAGVVSGAGGYSPGIILDKQHGEKERLPIALMGKVGCKVDASHNLIEAGDILTTADEPGYAMKAVDAAHSPGAILGKALAPYRSGKGTIPILVTLQ